MKATICPVCMGKGKYRPEGITAIGENQGYEEPICHGCGGKGWVEVKD